MAEIKNTFLKGKMNQDLDSRLLPNGEYREAINLMISRSEGSTVGEFENVLGNTVIREIDGNTSVVIGHFVDETNNIVYLLWTDFDSPSGARATNSDNCGITQISLNAPYTPEVLVEGFFLNFNKSFPVTGINKVEDLLFWTDNNNQPRKINIQLAQNTGHYTNEDQISVAKYAPCESVIVLDRHVARIAGTVSNSAVIDIDINTSNVKVGDIVSEFETVVVPTEIVEKRFVIAINASNQVTLNKTITTTTTNLKIVFERPTMTNKAQELNSNGAAALIVSTAGSGLTATYVFTTGFGQVLPEIGMLVTGPNSTVADNITITSVVANYAPTPASGDSNYPLAYNSITLQFSKDVSATPYFWVVGSSISIGVNQFYDGNWKGDDAFLEDKFVRFSYRFKFEDNEYSLMAPFSQVMFIPQQYGQFGGGAFSDEEDMDNAYKSTILSWFENNINNILLKIPMTSATAGGVRSGLHIEKVDILYKESDALAVKVLETLDLSLLNQTNTFPSISFKDAEHSNANSSDVVQAVTKYFLDYDYSSIKPYKTLPNNQITRVSDKVPIKALAQEVIGNRVVYGNYLDRHSSPAFIDFSAYASNKSTYYDNYTQFPNHQLKQDRTYQVGFILSDIYGRQSDVILSLRDGTANAGSTVFNPYNDLQLQQQTPIVNWLGNALNVTLYTAISGTGTAGEPGIYNAVTNPLGWYSYKIVVKQMQQEYYNVYLPGFVNGYPIREVVDAERDVSFFTTLQGDNVNKVPRDLAEVGPNDREFTTSENLIIRINNPTINNKTIANPIYQQDRAWNTQYYPVGIQQEVTQISTIRDLEIQAIPFKADVAKGEYGESNILQAYNYDDTANPTTVTSVNETPEPTGAIPWGRTGPDAAFYNGDSNPFVLKGEQSQNKNNPIGAEVFLNSVNAIPPLETQLSMVPFLSVAETRPVESLLDIYWETSLSGNLINLNSLVNTQSDGIVGDNFEAASFSESIGAGEIIGFGFNFLNEVGQFVPASQVTLNSITVTNGASTVLPSTTFTVTKNTQQTSFVIKTGNANFFYSESILNNALLGTYNIEVDVDFNSVNTVLTLAPLTLTNVAPTIDAFTQPTPSAAIGTIITLAGKNGSADATVNTTELNWSIVSISPVEDPAKIQINATTGELSNDAILTNTAFYSISVKATDCNGNGLDSIPRSVEFQIGSAASNRVNAALCQGWQGSAFTGCNESLGVVFAESRFTPLAVPTSSVTVGSVTYPANNQANSYNVFDKNQSTGGEFAPTVNHTTGALEQGTLYITPTLTNVGGTESDDDYVTFTIQFKSPSGGGWVQAVDTNTATIGNITLQVGNDATVDSKHVFDVAGEYRVLTTVVAGGMCSLGQTGTSLRVNFGDENFSSCAGAPA